MKLYISGPMSGKLNYNRELFDYAEVELQKAGFSPVNPHRLHNDSTPMSWENYMRKDIQELCKCDGIVMLQGWTKSRGAKLEFMLAVELGLHLYSSPEEAISWGALLNG